MDFIENIIPRDLTQGIGSTDVGNDSGTTAAQFYIGVGEGLGNPYSSICRRLQEVKQEDVLSLPQ